MDNENGHAEEEVKVEVRDLLPPAINLYVPAKGLKVQKGIENTLTAVIAHRDLAGFKVEWVRAGVVVSTDTTYTFKENQVGVFPITITASNEDGETKKELEIEVVENMPYEVVFLPRLMSSLFPHAIRLPGDQCSCVHCWTISRIRNTAGA